MQKISATRLEHYTSDKKAKRAYLKESFRYGGIGAILFLAAVALLLFKGMEFGVNASIGIFLLGITGFGFEYLLHFKAKHKRPLCRSCGALYTIYQNADRPNDTEYLYVCDDCRLYFKVLHSEEAKDIS